MNGIKVYWCGVCAKKGIIVKTTRKETRRHIREFHGIKGESIKKDEGSRVSVSTLSEEI